MEQRNNPSGAMIVGISEKGEAICAAAARISTTAGDAIDILQRSADAEKNQALIQKVMASGHTSVLEHIYFNIAFHNVSAFVEQFMIEFRMASFTVKSRRYVDFSQVGYYVPDFAQPGVAADFRAHVDTLFTDYAFLIEQGIPKEDARFLLPYCYFSNFYCSMNARELQYMLQAMLQGRGKAFPEIHKLGQQLLRQAQEYAPAIFGPVGDKKDLHPFSLPSSIHVTDTEQVGEVTPCVELLAGSEHPAHLVAQTTLIQATGMQSAAIETQLRDPAVLEEVLRAYMLSERPRALENIVFTFRINHVSLAGITHFARHRMQSIMIPSLAQVEKHNYIMPESVRKNPDALGKYRQAFARNADFADSLLKRGVPAEDAAYLALSGNTLDITTTMNARELLLFFKLRTCNRAQWEVRTIAMDMLSLLREGAPALFRHMGPSCFVTGRCPEGRLTCGKMQQVCEAFASTQLPERGDSNA